MRIIADLSCNFQQLDDILYTIETINCEFIKLQYYSERDLYGDGSNDTKLKLDWMPTIFSHCKKHGKRLMCTVFNHHNLKVINPYVYAHKVASSEITDLDLLKALKVLDKPIYVSTGGATKEEIEIALGYLKGCTVALLACDVEYPSKRHTIRNLLYLKSMFPTLNVGYSDHSLDIKNYCYEKHVKPNLGHPSYEQHALTVNEFNEMVLAISGKDKTLPTNPHKRFYSEEHKRWVRPRV
jgi:sialic acid synthase SpsE